MYVEDEHVQQWIAAHSAIVAGPGLSRTFGAYLDSLPWNSVGSALEWVGLPSIEVDLNSAEARQVISSSRIGRHDQVFFLYEPDEPGIITSVTDALESLDELYVGAPGRRYLCGVDIRDSEERLAVDDFAEYDGGQRLIVRL